MKKAAFSSVFGCLWALSAHGQQAEGLRALPAPDSARTLSSVVVRPARPSGRVLLRGFAVPAALVAAGAFTTEHMAVFDADEAVREESQEHLRWVRTNADDQLRHLPAYTTLGLGLLGIKGEHNTLNQAVLFALTYTLNNTITSNLKRITRVERPQGNSFDSFPSQHTSAAFSAARFLDKEYGAQSIWYRVGGYTVATGVAGLRVAKDNHWLSDVLAGAGVGMLSTEIVYRVYPLLQRATRKIVGPDSRFGRQAVLLPSYTNGATGATLVLVL
ncbi:phosphatase PAP2 family protein [Hymenobacter metallicola]|uniref:Phosphatase PAP2 family protein n=1 Tax=Hymenobacter metallicola TaxID=2563114 RepID=A0A4Z0PXY6_9BACT|nr:phosphatase PAP2 family protein [Hymenobacter metallicola]TGE22628.1 phosphatase PAP2 family protein [Hymenobacter metallicola]